MTNATRDMFREAPRTGPWIIGYAVSIGAAFAANASGTLPPRQVALLWIPIVICTAMIVYTSWRRHRMLGTLSPAVRRFWPRMVLSAGFMFLAYCLLAYAQMVGEWSAHAQTLVAALSALGFAGMIWCVHQYVIDETDEYLRAQAIRQLLVASFVALIVSLAWATLLPLFGMKSIGIGLVVLVWFAGLGIGRLVNEMRP